MVRAVSALLDGEAVTVARAVTLRDGWRQRNQPLQDFLCTECGGLVDPHRQGPGSPAHFEHRDRTASCTLSAPKGGGGRAANTTPASEPGLVSTDQLNRLLAGGDSYIRTKDGIVKGLALRLDLNPQAPGVILVGKGPRIEANARLFLDCAASVPVYIKRATGWWKFVGCYRAIGYKTDPVTIMRWHGDRPVDDIAGVLFLEQTDEVVVEVRSGGFGDPETRRRVERAAVGHVTNHFRAMGYRVESHEALNLGYDLLVEGPTEVLLVEVKGTSGPVERFFLSRNENRCAAKVNWRLAMVTSALSTPKMRLMPLDELKQRFQFDELAWECTLAKT